MIEALSRECGDCQLCCRLLPMKAGRHDIPAMFAKMVERGMMSDSAAKIALMGMVPEFDKPPGERCPHQRHHVGCVIYRTRPFGCRSWSCRWLLNDDTADQHRPDRAHYVIDPTPDFVKIDPEGGNNPATVVPVIQIWLDPRYPDAHRDPALRAYLVRRAEQDGAAAIIRLSSTKAFLLVAPPMNKDGTWFEHHAGVSEAEHTADEKLLALGELTINLEKL
jgi:Putative zinc- or iron-chelating domain